MKTSTKFIIFVNLVVFGAIGVSQYHKYLAAQDQITIELDHDTEGDLWVADWARRQGAWPGVPGWDPFCVDHDLRSGSFSCDISHLEGNILTLAGIDLNTGFNLLFGAHGDRVSSNHARGIPMVLNPDSHDAPQPGHCSRSPEGTAYICNIDHR